MITRDLADVIAALAFPIISEIEPPDAPESPDAMRSQAAGFLEAGPSAAPVQRTRHLAGAGSGLDVLSTFELMQITLHGVLGAFVHFGLTQAIEAVHRRTHKTTVETADLRRILDQPAVLETALQKELVARGLAADDARRIGMEAIVSAKSSLGLNDK